MANPRNTSVPINSYFHASAIINRSMKDGNKCIKRGKITANPVYEEKTSRAKMEINNTNPILRIRGAQ